MNVLGRPGWHRRMIFYAAFRGWEKTKIIIVSAFDLDMVYKCSWPLKKL